MQQASSTAIFDELCTRKELPFTARTRVHFSLFDTSKTRVHFSLFDTSKTAVDDAYCNPSIEDWLYTSQVANLKLVLGDIETLGLVLS